MLKLKSAIIGVSFAIIAQAGVWVWDLGVQNDRIEHLEQITKVLSDGSLIATMSRIDERTSRQDHWLEVQRVKLDKIEDELLTHRRR